MTSTDKKYISWIQHWCELNIILAVCNFLLIWSWKFFGTIINAERLISYIPQLKVCRGSPCQRPLTNLRKYSSKGLCGEWHTYNQKKAIVIHNLRHKNYSTEHSQWSNVLLLQTSNYKFIGTLAPQPLKWKPEGLVLVTSCILSTTVLSQTANTDNLLKQ